MNQKRKGDLLAILSACMFGLSPLWVTAFARGGGNSMMMALLRNIFFLPVSAFLLYRSGQPLFQKLPRKTLGKILLLSAGGSGLTQLLLFASYSFMASGVCTTVHFIYPLFVFLLGAVFYGEKLSRRSILCLALCMVGLCCFYPRGGEISMTGLIIALASGLTYAFYMVYLDKGGFEGISPLQMQFWLALCNAGLMLICCMVSGNLTFDLTPTAWLLGIVASQVLGFGVVLCQMGIKAIGAGRAALLSTFEPITSLVVGVLFMQEHLDPIAILGAAIILASVTIVSLPEKA
ncbi:MAG: EamA family transporter [Clostridia bacterium]|nr:EamA family transporter [Clostridia bacterium]